MSASDRSALMSRIRGKDTKPEIGLRKALFALGLRYRLHSGSLPGRPDIVLPKYRTVVFVHGCFWHGHNCRLFKWPRQNRAFWQEKIARNRERDKSVRRQLRTAGWRIVTVWECAIRKASPLRFREAAEAIQDVLRVPSARGWVRVPADRHLTDISAL